MAQTNEDLMSNNPTEMGTMRNLRTGTHLIGSIRRGEVDDKNLDGLIDID